MLAKEILTLPELQKLKNQTLYMKVLSDRFLKVQVIQNEKYGLAFTCKEWGILPWKDLHAKGFRIMIDIDKLIECLTPDDEIMVIPPESGVLITDGGAQLCGDRFLAKFKKAYLFIKTSGGKIRTIPLHGVIQQGGNLVILGDIIN